jgi:uncharacterized membrane protein
MEYKLHSKREIIRVAGRLKELTVIKDDKGNVVHKILSPIMLEFRPKDVLQVIVGATILAIPVAFTEEVWNLGTVLPTANIASIAGLSLGFIAMFVYYNYYRTDFGQHWDEFLKRVFSTYFFSFLIVAFILTLVGQAPWTTDFVLAIKRAIIVAFPASMSATIADTIK